MRCAVAILATILLVGSGGAVPAQTEAVRTPMRVTAEKLGAMKSKWNANKPKLRACRQQVTAQGLTGDDRWFFIEDCMNRS